MKEINNNVDLGSIKIHKKVLAGIVHTALDEIEGISLLTTNVKNVVEKFMGVQEFPGIDIVVDKNNQVVIEVQVCIQYGMNLIDMARLAQDTIRAAIEKSVDIDLKDININIQGMERKPLVKQPEEPSE